VNLTRENTAIVLDSTADFPDAQIRFPNMRVVPLYVRFGEESFRDYVELDPHDFYARLKTAPELPTTSQPTPQDFLTVYHALSGYERIYSLHISAKLSGTFQSASLAAVEEGERIRLVDTESASVGIGMLALAIQELLAQGTTDEAVEALIAQHRERAGRLPRGGGLDGDDARVGVRGADHHRVGLARQVHVVGVAAEALDEAGIFDARHRLAHRELLDRHGIAHGGGS